jgi:antitoxin FitA
MIDLSERTERIDCIDRIEIIDHDERISTGEIPIPMSSITIRKLDPALKERLRVRAAEHGHSMEAEVRRILLTTLTGPEQPAGRNLSERIQARFAPFHGIELDLPPRQPTREPPRFD